MKEQFYLIINIITLVAYFVPLVIVLYRKLWKDIPVFLFGCYWAAGGTINLLGSYPILPANTFEIVSVIYCIIDAPFIFFVFLLNTNVAYLRRMLKILIPLYVFAEIINGFIQGFKSESFVDMQGLGVAVVIGIVIAEIFNYFQKLDHTPREKATSFFYLAVLFEYAIYVYYHINLYIIRTEAERDMNILYYASSLIAIIIACIGFFSGAFGKKPPNTQPLRRNEVLINIID